MGKMNGRGPAHMLHLSARPVHGLDLEHRAMSSGPWGWNLAVIVLIAAASRAAAPPFLLLPNFQYCRPDMCCFMF